jgi:hypothetical protein
LDCVTPSSSSATSASTISRSPSADDDRGRIRLSRFSPTPACAGRRGPLPGRPGPTSRPLMVPGPAEQQRLTPDALHDVWSVWRLRVPHAEAAAAVDSVLPSQG